MLTRHKLTGVVAALLMGAAVPAGLLLFPARAQAQLPPLPGGAIPVQDLPVETATTDMDTVQEPGILTQTTTTATSVSTGEGTPNFTPINGYLGELNNQLFGILNADNFTGDFPGGEPLENESTPIAEDITSDTIGTYTNAMAIAQSQMNELGGENLSNIEQTSTSTNNLLAALQANTDAVLAVAQQLQLQRQLLATLIVVEATEHAQQLSAVAQARATEERSMHTGETP